MLLAPVLAVTLGLMLPLPSSALVERPTVAKKTKKTTGIEWEITPAAVVVHLDGRKLGRAGDLKVTRTKAGRHTVRLVHGGDETELEIEVTAGQRLRFVFDFSE